MFCNLFNLIKLFHLYLNHVYMSFHHYCTSCWWSNLTSSLYNTFICKLDTHPLFLISFTSLTILYSSIFVYHLMSLFCYTYYVFVLPFLSITLTSYCFVCFLWLPYLFTLSTNHSIFVHSSSFWSSSSSPFSPSLCLLPFPSFIPILLLLLLYLLPLSFLSNLFFSPFHFVCVLFLLISLSSLLLIHTSPYLSSPDIIRWLFRPCSFFCHVHLSSPSTLVIFVQSLINFLSQWAHYFFLYF